MWREQADGGSAGVAASSFREPAPTPAFTPRIKPAPRLLILSASTGAGHVRAADALQAAFRRLRPGAQVRHTDALTLATRMFRRCYGGMYLDFIDSHPLVLKYFYTCMDEPRPVGTVNHWDRLRLCLQRVSLRPLLRLVRSEPWDLIVSTHFLPGELVASLRRRRKIDTPHVMVTTDFETHRLWITEPSEHYFTATEEGALYIRRMGVDPARTSVTGIPVDPVFSDPKSRGDCLARHGLRGDRPVLLVMAGGYGVGRVEQLYESVMEAEVPLEVVVVTGRNAEAKARLEARAPPARHRVTVLGFTRKVDELMRAADLLVSKPGGMTVSEALAVGLPLVIVDPVPGQEERNSDFLLENGAAVKCNHLLTMGRKVGDLLRDPGRLAQLRAAARRLGRPGAAFDVAQRCLALLPPAPRVAAPARAQLVPLAVAAGPSGEAVRVG